MNTSNLLADVISSLAIEEETLEVSTEGITPGSYESGCYNTLSLLSDTKFSVTPDAIIAYCLDNGGLPDVGILREYISSGKHPCGKSWDIILSRVYRKNMFSILQGITRSLTNKSSSLSSWSVHKADVDLLRSAIAGCKLTTSLFTKESADELLRKALVAYKTHAMDPMATLPKTPIEDEAVYVDLSMVTTDTILAEVYQFVLSHSHWTLSSIQGIGITLLKAISCLLHGYRKCDYRRNRLDSNSPVSRSIAPRTQVGKLDACDVSKVHDFYKKVHGVDIYVDPVALILSKDPLRLLHLKYKAVSPIIQGVRAREECISTPAYQQAFSYALLVNRCLNL